MRNRYRLYLAAISMAAFMIAIAAVGASGNSDADASGGCGNGLTWTYTLSNKTLEIQLTDPNENGKMADYDGTGYNNAPWHELEIEKVVIGSEVKNIGSAAFYNCTTLTAVTFSEGSKLTTIGNYAFYDCEKLKGDSSGNLAIPNSVTKISDYAFYNCVNLTTVTFSEGSKLTTIGDYAFHNCVNLTTVTFSEGSKLTTIGISAFYCCTKLTTVTFSEGSKLTTIGNYAFYYCTSLKGDSSGNLAIPDSVTEIGDGAFNYCTSLTAVTLPENDSFTKIGDGTFYNCGNLKGDSSGNLAIPDSVTKIGDGAFCYCTSLTAVTFSEGSKLTTIGISAFYDCEKLTTVTIPGSVKTIGDSAFCYCGLKCDLVIPSSVTTIGNYAFYDCTSLTSITMPGTDYATSVSGVFSPSVAFYKDGEPLSNPTWADLGTDTWYGDGNGKFYNGKLTVVFDTNGGPGNAPDSIKVEYGGKYSNLPDYPDAQLKAYFTGWFTGKTGGAQVAKDTDVMLLPSPQKLYAHWEDYVKVTFDGNGSDRGSMEPQYIGASDQNKNLKPNAFEKDGFGLYGWYEAADPEKIYDDKADVLDIIGSIDRPHMTLELIAKWDSVYNVTVDTSDPGIASVEYMIGEGGTFVSYTAPFEVVHGSKLTLRAVVEDGYEFKEWQPSGETDVQLVIGSVTSDIELAPKATKFQPEPPTPTPKPKPQVITVTVTFESVGGGHTSEESIRVPLNSKIMVYGSTLVIGNGNATVKAIPDAGHVFSEWVMDEALLLGGGLLSDTVITASFGETVLAGMYIWKEPDKVDYSEGEKFDPARLVIALKYSDGSEVHVDYQGNESKFAFSPSLDTPLKASDDKVTVKYGGMSAVQEITVSENGFPWWIVLIVAALAFLILFIVLKRRKDDEEESVG